VLVKVPTVIMHVEQPHVARALWHDGREVSSEMGMAGVEAHPHPEGRQHVEEPEQIGRLSREEVWEHIFEEEVDAVHLAVRRHLGEHPDRMVHPLASFLRAAVRLLWSRMHHEIPYAQQRGRLDGAEELLQAGLEGVHDGALEGERPLRVEIGLGREIEVHVVNVKIGD
jgi:hypothetical protein